MGRVCTLHDRESEKRTLKRKYFMLFKCVLYYILTAINFIRLFIRAVFHRGLKREWVNENTRIRSAVCRRRIKWEPLKKLEVYKSHPHQVKATPSLYHLSVLSFPSPPREYTYSAYKDMEKRNKSSKWKGIMKTKRKKM